MDKKKTATLTVDGQSIELPIIEGTEGETAVDISRLRGNTGLITFDNGLMNTGSCQSSITFVDGEKGILRYRGYDIADLAEHGTFLESAYLLLNGELPSASELSQFENELADHRDIPSEMVALLQSFPTDSHPMAVVSSMFASMSAFYPAPTYPTDDFDAVRSRILAKVATITAYTYRHAKGLDLIPPNKKLGYVENFLHMMFSEPSQPYEADPVVVRAMERVMILHADHEQNCSASSARMVGSGHVNLYSVISAATSALWGNLHGGAAQAVVDMLLMIQEDDADLDEWIARAKDKTNPFRLMGFGHRVYKNYDPRAVIMKKTAHEVLQALKVDDPLLDLGQTLEEIALNDEYFVSRNLYPNVDFYSGIIYRAIGLPVDMFTVMFTLARVPGWVSQWKEMADDPAWRIWRPRQVYQGQVQRKYVPIHERD